MSITEEGFDRCVDRTASDIFPPIAEWEETVSKDEGGDDITTVLPLPKEQITEVVLIVETGARDGLDASANISYQ